MKEKNIPLQLRALCAWFIQNIMLDFYFEEMKYLQHFLYKNKFDWSFDPSPDISEVFSICTLWSKSNNLVWKSTFLIMFVWSGVWPLWSSFFSLLLFKISFILTIWKFSHIRMIWLSPYEQVSIAWDEAIFLWFAIFII